MRYILIIIVTVVYHTVLNFDNMATSILRPVPTVRLIAENYLNIMTDDKVCRFIKQLWFGQTPLTLKILINYTNNYP